MNKRFSLQLFTDGETKTFTREELENAIEARIARERANFRKQLNDKDVEWQTKLAQDIKDEAEKQKKLSEIELNKIKKEKEDFEKELSVYRIANRKSEIITTYAKDNLPCPNEFVEVADLFSTIEDDSLRANVYSAFKKYINTIEEHYKKEFLKGGSNPNGSGKDNVNVGVNPFKDGNFTEMLTIIKNDYEKAVELAQASGMYEKYKYLFNK